MKVRLALLLAALLAIAGGSYAYLRLFPKPTAANTPTENWKIADGKTDHLRGVHLGGKWGLNKENIEKGEVPVEYLAYLRDLHVNWVGIEVSIHIDDSMDASIERKTSGVAVPSFSDEELTKIITSLHERGFKVMVNLAFEDNNSKLAAKPVARNQIGDPQVPGWTNSAVKVENWPWDTKYSAHGSFVSTFWQSYTEQATAVAKILATQHVESYAIGTETDGLFRTRTGGAWTDEFSAQLKTLVKSVRDNYSGQVTYIANPYTFSPDNTYYQISTRTVWNDLALDTIGVNGTFPLAGLAATRIPSVGDVRSAWQIVFDQWLMPVKTMNSDKPIVFYELQYPNTTTSALDPSKGLYETAVATDTDNDSKEDGDETQANILDALYSTISTKGVVTGTFVSGQQIATKDQWAASFAKVRDYAIRDRQAELVVRNIYQTWQ